MKNTTVLVILNLNWRINATQNRKTFHLPIHRSRNHLTSHAHSEFITPSANFIQFRSVQVKGGARVPIHKLKGKYSHSDEIASVNSFHTFENHRFHTKKRRTFGRPITRRSHSIIFSGNHDQGSAIRTVLDRKSTHLNS